MGDGYKAMTIRFDVILAEYLGTVASVDGLAMNEVVTDAVREVVTRRLAEPEFQEKLAASVASMQRLLLPTRSGSRDE